MMKRAFFLVAAALALEFSATAQTTFATITGMVTDPQGAVIAGAQVTATLVSSNYQYKARSNEVGYYTDSSEKSVGEFGLGQLAK
jgi:Carboxypeptidase regulatory-like domain